jgi:Zn-dependent alcohol dehydrogenase
VAPGDYVILNWCAVCGSCRSCRRGRPWYCFSTFNATQKMTLLDGTELSPALGIGAFVEQDLVAAGQCTKVNPAAPATAAGLLGCGVMAGIGAAINTGNVGRGDSVAGVRVRRGRATRPSPVPGWRARAHDRRGRPRRSQGWMGPSSSAPPTP